MKSFYKQQYNEVLDPSVSSIEDHFNQPGSKINRSLETLVMKACKQHDLVLILSCRDFYNGDFYQEPLHTQLQTLGVHY